MIHVGSHKIIHSSPRNIVFYVESSRCASVEKRVYFIEWSNHGVEKTTHSWFKQRFVARFPIWIGGNSEIYNGIRDTASSFYPCSLTHSTHSFSRYSFSSYRPLLVVHAVGWLLTAVLTFFLFFLHLQSSDVRMLIYLAVCLMYSEMLEWKKISN